VRAYLFGIHSFASGARGEVARAATSRATECPTDLDDDTFFSGLGISGDERSCPSTSRERLMWRKQRRLARFSHQISARDTHNDAREARASLPARCTRRPP
jgi:hypothetical protein